MKLSFGSLGVVVAVASMSLPASAVPIAGLGTWEQTLHARDVNGDGKVDAYFDETQNVSWLANALVARVRNPSTGRLTQEGRMTWHDAVAFVDDFSLYGVTGWRLYKSFPIKANGFCTKVDSGSGTDCGYSVTPTTSEMARLYYEVLGNVGQYDKGWNPDLSNTGPFRNVAHAHYWSETTKLERAWNFGGGKQYIDGVLMGAYQQIGTMYLPKGNHDVWPVLDGDIADKLPTITTASQVPEPATALQLVAGVLFLLGIGAKSRQRRST